MAINTSPRDPARISRRETLSLLGAPLLLALGRANAQAGLQSYDVELVVFRNLSSTGTGEDWATESGINGLTTSTDSNTETQAEAAPLTAPTATFPPLAAGRLKLTAIADTLRRSRRYQPLAHFGWTQPGYPRNDARFIPVDSVMGSASSGVSGRIALARGRYLHLTLDLSVAGDGGERYVLQQTRRMRSNERHYIDHPRFGVIALITQSES